MATSPETKNQVNIGLRYFGTAAGTLFTIMGAVAVITPDQAHQLTVALHEFNDSVVTGYGALLKMWIILGPVGIGILTTLGVKSGAVKSMGAKLLDIATGGAKSSDTPSEAKQAIANASDAKQVLIAATIALPEVQTIVTDKKTADAAPSESVVTAESVTIIPPTK